MTKLHPPSIAFRIALEDLEKSSINNQKAELRTLFNLVEYNFLYGHSWEQLETELQQVESMTDPMGRIGPLWIAVQMALDKPIRASHEHTEVAIDILYNLNTHGKMRYISPAPDS